MLYMAVRTIHSEKDTVYFITITCFNWLPLIAKTNLYDFIYGWFIRIHTSGMKILGYVIMPNHIHLLMYLPEIKRSLNTIIGEAKRFMAYEIIKRLKGNNDLKTLNYLQQSVSDDQTKAGQKHRVFIHSFDARICNDKYLIEQKLDYIHANPVSGKWSLAEDFTQYPYSSAAFYELGQESKVPLMHYLDFTG